MKTCKHCGESITWVNRSGFCSRTKECCNARKNQYYANETESKKRQRRADAKKRNGWQPAPRKPCSVCGDLIYASNILGICTSRCRVEHRKAYNTGHDNVANKKAMIIRRLRGTKPGNEGRRKGRYCFCKFCGTPVGYRCLSQILPNGTCCSVHSRNYKGD